MGPATVRRTQAERTAETTAKLLDATADCLVERGYAGTSTVEVCRRAGVSRGALVHHFPSKDDLVAAAVHFGRGTHSAIGRCLPGPTAA